MSGIGAAGRPRPGEGEGQEMISSKMIRELGCGDRLVGAVYLLEEKEIRTTSQGSPYLSARLRDQTGSIQGRLWNLPSGIAGSLQEGQGVKITGEVTTYREQLQLRIDAIQPCPVDTSAFLSTSSRSAEEMERELRERIAGVVDSHLRGLLERVFLDDPDFLRRFISAPAAKFYHHACLGGLIEHSLGVAMLADKIASLYPELSRDLLLTVALLHDVGKVESYEWQAKLEASDDGELLEHIYLGTRRVEQAIDSLGDFPEELRRLVLHALLSHHGEQAKGSPVPPKALEAVVLHLLDMIDSHVRGFLDHIARQACSATAWTDKSPMFGSRLYRRK